MKTHCYRRKRRLTFGREREKRFNRDELENIDEDELGDLIIKSEFEVARKELEKNNQEE